VTAGATRLLKSRGLWLIGLLVLTGFGFAALLHSAGGAERVAVALGPGAPLVVVPVLGVISATPFPSEILAVPTASLYGVWWGSWIIWSAWMLAALIQFSVARRTARELEFDATLARLPRWLRRFPVSHPVFLICARWLPLGPHLVNSAAGAYDVPLSRHLGCAAIGIAPQALFFSGLGNLVFRLL
jgi:uncharacterized membrane protein YdjX (TVP38/TMEM64 family)